MSCVRAKRDVQTGCIPERNVKMWKNCIKSDEMFFKNHFELISNQRFVF